MGFEEIPKLIPAVENSAEPRQDDNARRAAILRQAKRIMGYYVNMRPRMDENEFADVYSAKEIRADKEKIRLLQKKEEQPENGALIMEHLVVDKGQEWYGSSVNFIALAEYDNHEAHGDVVMEIKIGNKMIRILLDLTTAADPEKTNQKISRSEMLIKGGKLSDIKYFSSKAEILRGKLRNVPRAVCGASLDRLIETSKAMAGDDEIENIIPYMLLDEIVSQLIWFKQKANQNPYFSEALKKKIEEAAEAVMDLKTDLNISSEGAKRMRTDNVFKRLELVK